MAGMRAKHQKSGNVTYKFTGDLAECIKKAEKELHEKRDSQQRVFLKWQRDNAVKAYETYERRIEDLKDFVKLGKEELKKRQEVQQDGESENI